MRNILPSAPLQGDVHTNAHEHPQHCKDTMLLYLLALHSQDMSAGRLSYLHAIEALSGLSSTARQEESNGCLIIIILILSQSKRHRD